MKVLVGEFVTESNANIPTICTIKQYDIGLGEDCIQKMGIREVFERNDVTLIPSIYANAGAAGVVEKSAFTYIEHPPSASFPSLQVFHTALPRSVLLPVCRSARFSFYRRLKHSKDPSDRYR